MSGRIPLIFNTKTSLSTLQNNIQSTPSCGACWEVQYRWSCAAAISRPPYRYRDIQIKTFTTYLRWFKYVFWTVTLHIMHQLSTNNRLIVNIEFDERVHWPYRRCTRQASAHCVDAYNLFQKGIKYFNFHRVAPCRNCFVNQHELICRQVCPIMLYWCER